MKKIHLLLASMCMSIAAFSQTATGTVSGKITLGNTTTPAYPASVYIIQEAFVDSVTSTGDTVRDIVLTIIDSLGTDTGGNYSASITVSTSPTNQVLVKAALLPSSSVYNDYLPAYYQSSPSFAGPALEWSWATWLDQPLPSSTTADIALPAGTYTSGPGFISGSVFAGAGKGTGPAKLAHRILILTDLSNNAVAYAYSDASGNFSFSGLPTGSYKLFGDAWGKDNPAISIDITSSSYSVKGVVFEENSTSFKGHIVPEAVKSVNSAMDNITVYPNPAIDQVNISGLENIKGDKEIIVNNIAGAIIYKSTFSGTEQVTIPCSQWPQGVYFMQIQTTGGMTNFKIAK